MRRVARTCLARLPQLQNSMGEGEEERTRGGGHTECGQAAVLFRMCSARELYSSTASTEGVVFQYRTCQRTTENMREYCVCAAIQGIAQGWRRWVFLFFSFLTSYSPHSLAAQSFSLGLCETPELWRQDPCTMVPSTDRCLVLPSCGAAPPLRTTANPS